jgi:hypothetical protein
MKRNDLLEVLTVLKPCIKKNTVIPSLSNVSFKNDTVEVFNGIQGMKVEFISGLECAVDGTDLFKIISSFTGEEVSLSVGDDLLKIKCGKSVYKMNVDKPSNYFPNDEGIVYKNIPPDFLEGVKKCLNFASKDITKEDRYGVTVSNDTLYSTNGIGIAKFSLENDIGIKHILPESFLKIIKSLGDEDLLIGSSKDAIFVLSNKCRIFTMINEIELLNYENVLNNYDISNLSFSKITDELREVVSRIETVSSNSSKEVTFHSDECLLVECTTPNIVIKETVDFNLGNKFTSKFEISLLQKMIENSFELASIILDEDVVIVGRDEDFLCLVTNIL